MMDIPKDKLRQGRIEAFTKLKKERRRKKQWQGITAVAILFLSFLLTVRVSPTIASYAAKIPGLSVIVELVQENEGIKDAIANEYYEELGILVQDKDVTITLQGAIIDEYGVMLMYDFDYPTKKSNHHNYTVNIYQGDQQLKNSMSYGTKDSLDEPVAHSGHILELTLDQPLDTKNPNFRVEFEMRDGDKQTISIPFSLEKPIAKAKVVEPNTSITAQGQSLTISKIIRTPLRIHIEVKPDPSNTMQIVALDDISLELKNGSKRELIRNGLVGSGSFREGQSTFYLQSNYFYDSDELIVRIGKIQAIPKGEDYIEVDFKTKEVLYKPDFIDWDIKVVGNDVYVNAPVKDDHGRQPLYPAEKEDGTTLETEGCSYFTSAHEGFNYREYYVPYNGRAKLWISYIDNPIAKDVEIKIDLTD
ncbi:DUF4179 domain-containing protein [Solibacillus sp. FSL W7-1464]|uniref:DUF4179 domain-containing protein n=1 Tax=Solibacillus sp. FSL W7-1464 TaxID=2921706 RepID=UPI0030F568FC